MINRFALFLFVLLGLFAGNPARAQIDMQKTIEIENAMSRLLAVIDAAEVTGKYPRFSNPATTPLFNAAFDTGFLRSGEPDPGDLSTLAALQRKAGDVARSYISTGTTASGGDLARAARNFLEFLPEIAIAYDFSLVTGAHIARITADLSHQMATLGEQGPEINASLIAIAETQAQFLELMIGCSSDPNIRSNWRMERLVLLNRTAPQYAALLPTEMAQSIADRALAAAISEEEVTLAAELKQFALAILR